MPAASTGPQRLGPCGARAHLLLHADEVHDLLVREPAADAGELIAYLRRCFSSFDTRAHELARIAGQIIAWHEMVSPARALVLTRSALAQHAVLLLRRRVHAASVSRR